MTGDEAGAATELASKGMDRRTLIKRGAAAGAVAWSAPVVLGSVSSPAAAQTIEAGCFKYMFDWRWASLFENAGSCEQPNGFQQDANNCGQNVGETHSEQEFPDPNCCQDKAPIGPGGEGNDVPWYEFPDAPAGCITVTTNDPNGCAGSTNTTGGLTVTFSINQAVCPGCRLVDGMVLYDSSGDLDDGTFDGDCGDLSLSINGLASSTLYNSVTATFDDPKVPVWFKFFVMCGYVLDENQSGSCEFPPCTDCQEADSINVAI